MNATSADATLTPYARSLIAFKAQQLARRAEFRRYEEVDLQQALWAMLIRRWPKFDPARSSANTFAARVVDSAAATLIRERGRLKRAPSFRVGSLDEPSGADTVAARDFITEHEVSRWTGADAREATPESAEANERIQRAIAALPDEHIQVASRLMAGQSPTAVARELRISRRQVRKIMEAIRVHLVAHGVDNDF